MIIYSNFSLDIRGKYIDIIPTLVLYTISYSKNGIGTLRLHLIYSFLIQSNIVTPHIHFNMLVSTTSILILPCHYLLFNAQHSDPKYCLHHVCFTQFPFPPK